jgi:hypothetical protein
MGRGRVAVALHHLSLRDQLSEDGWRRHGDQEFSAEHEIGAEDAVRRR